MGPVSADLLRLAISAMLLLLNIKAASAGTPDPYIAAFEDTESVLLRERCPNLLPCGEDADRFPALEDGKRLIEGLGLPDGLSLPSGPAPRYVPASPDSLALGLCCRELSAFRFFIMALWSEPELIVLLKVGMVVDRDWEKRRPPNPGPGALIGVSGEPALESGPAL